MKNTKCTLNELSSEQAVRVMNDKNQSALKGGDWGGCCQYPPADDSSWDGNGSWWNWVWSWFQNNQSN